MAELETVEQGITNETTPAGEESGVKTFTQGEVNKLISARVNEVKREFADYEELKAKAEKIAEYEGTDLDALKEAQKRAEELKAKVKEMEEADALRKVRAAVSEKTGVPVNLLHGTDAEACEKEASAILAFAKPKYPSVSDGGETTVTPKTRDEILAIKDNKERLREIEKNIDLFEN